MTYSDGQKRILSRMGYYDYQRGLIYRHLNHNGAWDGHLARSRNFILKAVDYCNPYQVTVLGSGWLLDIPLAELLEKGIKVRLVDIVHPPEVRNQTSGLNHVELVEDDVTGGLISEVWNKCHLYSSLFRLKSIGEIAVPGYRPGYEPGMVVSLNILTQLESMILRFLENRSSIYPADLLQFRTLIQERHMAFLGKHKSVLISDVSESYRSKSGHSTAVPTLLTKIPEGIFNEEWVWDFDPDGIDFKGRRSTLSVKAVLL
jgi:hypothetical protein